AWTIRKSKSRQRRHNHIERVQRRTASAGRIGQHWNDLVHAVERIGPAVGKDDRHWVGSLAAFVNEVDAQSIEVHFEVRELGELCLLYPPVKLVLPVSHQALEVGRVR